MDACRDTNVPLIAQFHGYDAYRESLLRQYSDEYQRLFQVASAVIAVSQHMRSQLLRLGAHPGKTFHNACGAELPAGMRARPGETGKRFLMVGRLVEKKAPFLAILAFSQVAAKYPDARLDIIGDGPLKYACQQLSRSLGLSALITFHGALPHSDVFDFMARSRCYVQHSVCAPDGDREGTPVGVLEAMGMGLPVVSTRHGGIVDIIENGTTGSLVVEYDVEGMAQALINYADDAGLAQQVGENARTVVLADWTSAKSVERLWEIIEQAICHG
jgi:glycosyltransferase involved in cell wall biosynthesis